MGLQEFQDLLDRYGGDPRDWPADRRSEALALAETSLDAYRLIEEMRRIELMLATAVDTPDPSPDAVSRVMDRIRDHESSLAGATMGYATAERKDPPSVGAVRALLSAVGDVLGGFVYRPIILFAAMSLAGILVGVADRAASLQEIQGGFLFFMMNP
jgi:hypothetical protein